VKLFFIFGGFMKRIFVLFQKHAYMLRSGEWSRKVNVFESLSFLDCAFPIEAGDGMKSVLLLVLASLFMLTAGISADAGLSVGAGAVTGLVVSDNASASADASVQALVSPSPSLAPVKTRVEKAQERRVNIQANVKDRLKDAKDRANEIREKARERLQEEKDRRENLRENTKDKLRDLKEERQNAVRDARQAEADSEAKVKALKSKDSLNESERDDLRNKTRLHLNASYRHRIELAKKMGSEGANATLVAEFVAYAQANWNQYANATNNSARKDLIKAFNQRWRAFKQAVTKDLLLNKLRTSVNATRQTLARLDAVIAKLTAGGFNTTALVNASASISARLDSVLAEPDVPHALSRLRQVHSGLVHLRNAIQRTVNRELVEAYREKAAPSVAADASLSIVSSVEASPTATAAAGSSGSASANSTNATGSAGSSASANASVA